MADVPECGVCYVDMFNKDNIVECFSCEFKACKGCLKKFFTDMSQLPHCMQCKTRWGIEFFTQQFGSWVSSNKKNGYRYHRKKALVDKAKAHIPEILTDIQRERDALKEKEKELYVLYAELALIREDIDENRDSINELSSLLFGKKIYTWNEKKEERAELKRLYAKGNRLSKKETSKIWDINELLRRGDSRVSSNPDKNYHFVCPCPRETCKGLVEKESFRCTVCEKKICRRCREPKQSKDKTGKKPKHVCNPDTLENLKLIRVDTKPCPECAVPIQKIDGCSQMWCPQCKFVYNWETGRKETGNIHNPHAIRWEREHGKLERDINDIPCGGLVEMRDLPTQSLTWQDNNRLQNIYRCISEIYLRQLTIKDSKDICRKYVLNEIDDKQFEQHLFTRDRTNERNQIKLDVLTTLRTLMVERFRDLAESGYANLPKQRIAMFDKFFAEAEEIRLFTNKAFMELKLVGTQKPPQLGSTWEWDPKY